MSKTDKPEILYRTSWGIPYKALNVLCPDGVRRTCDITGEADTYFTIPARTQAFGKTVHGFISSDNIPPANGSHEWTSDLTFTPTGKNQTAFGVVAAYIEHTWDMPRYTAEARERLRSWGVPDSWTFTVEERGKYDSKMLVARDPARSKTK